jgi:hypothetical protein
MPESPSGPEVAKDEREAGGTVYTEKTVHARHSGLVWDVRAGKSLDQSYFAANNAAKNAGTDNEVAAGGKSKKKKNCRKKVLLNVVNVHCSGDQEHVRAHVDHVVHV